MLDRHLESPVADWPTKRDWVDYAFDEFLAAGYHISSGYTVVRDPDKVNFSYRDNLWQGSDLLATGIASFGHISGVHYQNKPEWRDYVGDLLERGELPIGRAMRPTQHQLLIREMILQLKRGYLSREYFRRKFDTDIVARWQAQWQEHVNEGYATIDEREIRLTRAGLLRVDALLPPFFEPELQGVRYT
jgi:oxygen-independent coproporphyrinogen-3 oxidase